MEVDDEMLEIHNDPELILIALSAELDAIHELDNLDQLVLLMKECSIMQQFKIIPITQWKEERMIYIYIYQDLDWLHILNKTQHTNTYLYEASQRVIAAMKELTFLWNQNHFILDLYEFILHSVHSIWMHYRNTDCVESDAVDELSSAMLHM